MNLILLFIILSIINVIFSTIRTITTVKSGKFVASIISAGYFAFYNIVLIYSVADFNLIVKCAITFVCNLIGVFTVKLIEEKMRKDKLWKIEATIHTADISILVDYLKLHDIPNNYIQLNDRYTVFNIYCSSKHESTRAKTILEKVNAKYFVSATEVL